MAKSATFTKKINLNDFKLENKQSLFPKGKTNFVTPERKGNIALFLNHTDKKAVFDFVYDNQIEENYLNRLAGDFYNGFFDPHGYTKKQAQIKIKQLEKEWQDKGYTIYGM